MVEILEAETTVKLVTFFEDRAEVTRIAKVRVPAGRSQIHARGLTLLADDKSLATAANVDVVFARVRRSVEDTTEASAEQIQALETEVEGFRERLLDFDRALANVVSDSRRIAALLALWEQSVKAIPSRADKAREELARSYTSLDNRMTDAVDRHARFRTKREDIDAEVNRANARLAHARIRKPRYRAFAEIEIVSPDERDVTFEITYRTPCALWRPEHLARSVRKPDGTGEMSITTYATVWQFTGENWEDIPVRFSTARPARNASAPHLREDVLTTRKKTDQERQKIVVEAREQSIKTAGLARGTRDIDEMPGVEDGGEAQWLDAKSHATIESDGRPVRVEIGTRTIPCALARVAYPELGTTIHLRATATLQGTKPLLAGPVTVGRETEIVGRSTMKFVGPGEPFELGFGTDDGLRVRRMTSEKRKTTPVTGTQHLTREISIFVSNLSGESKSLSIIERIPVSEVEDVVIELQRQQGLRHDPRDGFATFDLTLTPQETRELKLEYRIEAKSNVVLPTLV